MPKQTRTNLLTRIKGIRDAFLPGVNTALLVGNLLLDWFESQPDDWNELTTYQPGERVVWRGMIYSCLNITLKGESPATAGYKWDNLLASQLEQIGDNLPDLPVTQKLLAAYVTKMLPPGGGGALVPAKATDAQFNEGVNNVAYVTPYQIKLLRDALTAGQDAPEFDFENWDEGYLPTVRRRLNGELYVAFLSPVEFTRPLVNELLKTDKRLRYGRGAGATLQIRSVGTDLDANDFD